VNAPVDPKRALRTAVRAARAALGSAERDRQSAIITRLLLAEPEIISAQTIHVYLAMPVEVDTLQFIGAQMSLGKRIVVPWMHEDRSMGASELLLADLQSITEVGPLRVPQAPLLRPVDDGCWDVVVVPLVAATLSGDRLGNGAGHYDRLLTLWPRPAIGVALSAQIVDSLPLETHDVRLTKLLTAPLIR
jgi:5-formyltetrahydrofolate cyclo-ligase